MRFPTFLSTALFSAAAILCIASPVYAAESDSTEADAAADTSAYYSLINDGGSWDGTHYTLDGQIINNSFFFDGTYTYYLQYDGTPMKDRLTYHPDGEHIIYFDEDGHEVFDQYAHITTSIAGDEVDDLCYFNTYGYMYVDVLTWDATGSVIFYINPCGVIETDCFVTFSNSVQWADGASAEVYHGGLGYCSEYGFLVCDAWGYDLQNQLLYFQSGGLAVYPPKDENAIAKMIADSCSNGMETDLDRVSAAAEVVAFICSHDNYTMKGDYYDTAYGVFVKGEYSCAGSTRALGLVLDYMGYAWTHENEHLYTHQWNILVMDGQIGYADGMAGVAGYGEHFYNSL